MAKGLVGAGRIHTSDRLPPKQEFYAQRFGRVGSKLRTGRTRNCVVGMAGFEPATFLGPTRLFYQAELHTPTHLTGAVHLAHILLRLLPRKICGKVLRQSPRLSHLVTVFNTNHMYSHAIVAYSRFQTFDTTHHKIVSIIHSGLL